MSSQTNEQALESIIEKRLTGTCLEELKEQGIPLSSVSENKELYIGGNGFLIGSPRKTGTYRQND
jgi:type I restriction enzyme R subunit